MTEHDPVKFATGLSARLATRSRHVCVLFGAGIARACGLPDLAQLQSKVIEGLLESDRLDFQGMLKGRTLEQALTRLRRIRALLTDQQTVDGLTAKRAAELDTAVCLKIVANLDVAAADMLPAKHFAAWAARANYHLPLEIFTVNYDLLLETALEMLGVPFFDGFAGVLRARFQSEMVESVPGADRDWLPSFFVRLWKLHGSVNWVWENQQIVRLGQTAANGAAAAIYPSDTKYEESRRVPFVVLQDRFRRALYTPETIALVSGYSFGDDHLNEMLFEAATRRERSEIVVFCRSKIPDGLAQRAIATPNLQVIGPTSAILGGVSGNWKPPEGAPPELWADNKLTLTDFAHLALYLARSTAPDGSDASLLKSLGDHSSVSPGVTNG
jgi:hypothetical protein